MDRKAFETAALWLHSAGNMAQLYALTGEPAYKAETLVNLGKAAELMRLGDA